MIQYMTHPSVVAVRQQLRIHIVSRILILQDINLMVSVKNVKLSPPLIFLAIAMN